MALRACLVALGALLGLGVPTWCPYCTRAMRIMDRMGINYSVYNLETARGAQRDVARQIVSRGMTVPQIFIDGHHIGGCDDLEAMIKGY